MTKPLVLVAATTGPSMTAARLERGSYPKSIRTVSYHVSWERLGCLVYTMYAGSGGKFEAK